MFRVKCCDEGFPQQGRLHSRIAELWIHGAEVWIREPKAQHLSLPISGTLISADGRMIMVGTLE